MAFPKPLGENVIIELDTEQQVKENSVIFIPDELKETPRSGIIKAVGNGLKYVTEEAGKALVVVSIDMEVKVGDRVIFKQLKGSPLKYNGTTYILMTQSDLSAII